MDAANSTVRLFLCGDVMTGRGIDQVLPESCRPILFESYVRNAGRYVDLAEMAHGSIPRPVDYRYVWGVALEELRLMAPDVRIINLETSVTTSDDYWPGKGINYRMHPGNVACLTVPGIDCCALGNNHVLDWGYDGLSETLATLRSAEIAVAGAGDCKTAAAAPAIMSRGLSSRILVFAGGSLTAGVPPAWAAGVDRPGVNYLPDFSRSTLATVRRQVRAARRDDDLIVYSMHWGENWGFEVPAEQRDFAHWLVDEAGVHVVHGHSSHHVKGVEIYRGHPIFYGCGDFVNDYEGIGGYEEFKGDLSLMYFLDMNLSAKTIAALTMTPTRMRRFRVEDASIDDRDWMTRTLNREGSALGTSVRSRGDGRLELRWDLCGPSSTGSGWPCS